MEKPAQTKAPVGWFYTISYISRCTLTRILGHTDSRHTCKHTCVATGRPPSEQTQRDTTHSLNTHPSTRTDTQGPHTHVTDRFTQIQASAVQRQAQGWHRHGPGMPSCTDVSVYRASQQPGQTSRLHTYACPLPDACLVDWALAFHSTL